jgi:hypothetical protein
MNRVMVLTEWPLEVLVTCHLHPDESVGISGCSGQMSVFHQGESNHCYLQVGFQSS